MRTRSDTRTEWELRDGNSEWIDVNAADPRFWIDRGEGGEEGKEDEEEEDDDDVVDDGFGWMLSVFVIKSLRDSAAA